MMRYRSTKKTAAEVKSTALDAIAESTEAVQNQQKIIDKAVAEQIEQERQRITNNLETQLAEIIQYHVKQVLQDQLTTDDQLDTIVAQLEANKKAILEDIGRGVLYSVHSSAFDECRWPLHRRITEPCNPGGGQDVPYYDSLYIGCCDLCQGIHASQK